MEALLRLCPSIDVNAAAPLAWMRATAMHLTCRMGDASNMRAKVLCLLKPSPKPEPKPKPGPEPPLTPTLPLTLPLSLSLTLRP
jgi:hypothetical protein